MKLRLYPRLAFMGIQKNKQLYVPYILTCIGMVLMFYIIQSLSYSPLLHEMRGGATMESILGIGKFVIAVFSLLFLNYSNSFLIRRRNREFGLYTILGMDKRGIGRIIAWEALMISAVGLVSGLAFGMLLSKLAELGLIRILHAEISYEFTFPVEAMRFTFEMYATIFFLLFLKSLWQVRRSDPLELLRSEAVGEKPPKANWLLALVGVALLGGAYYLAVTIQNPLSAFEVFFLAVIMVIVATYMLFMAGSVTLCKILQKNKGYYYKKQHFISVSTMAYRMKRNGAGLASICILWTMVLVMISSTASLYIGEEGSLLNRYPQKSHLVVEMEALSELEGDRITRLRDGYEAVFADYGVEPEQVVEYRYAYTNGLQQENFILTDASEVPFDLRMYDDLRLVLFVSCDDYNRAMGTNLSLEPGQALVNTIRCRYNYDTLTMRDFSLDVVGHVDDFMPIAESMTAIVPSIQVIVPDYVTLEPLSRQADFNGNRMLAAAWYYGYDLDVSNEESSQILQEQREAMPQVMTEQSGGYSYSWGNREEERLDFYSLYGGLFFLGIMLSLVFIFAAALIVYYKQVSEGWEDQTRFEIMQKVGMTKRDIRKSVNSQVLTVFFAPLLAAGVHQAFAFPMVWKILMIFNLNDRKLEILVTMCSFALFGLFYILIYKITAGAYYRIVSGRRRDS